MARKGLFRRSSARYGKVGQSRCAFVKSRYATAEVWYGRAVGVGNVLIGSDAARRGMVRRVLAVEFR